MGISRYGQCSLGRKRKCARQRRLVAVDGLELEGYAGGESAGQLCPVSVRLEHAIADCLQQIPRTQRDILERTMFAGETPREIAASLRIKRVSVRAGLSRARRAVQEWLTLHYPQLCAELRPWPGSLAMGASRAEPVETAMVTAIQSRLPALDAVPESCTSAAVARVSRSDAKRHQSVSWTRQAHR